MKSKNILLATALSLIVLSFSAFSQESRICANPLKAICKDTYNQRVARAGYIENIKKVIANEATKNSIPKMVELDKKYSSKFFYFYKQYMAYIIRNQEIFKSAKARIKGIESVVTNPKYIRLLKTYMMQAIDESNFNQRYRDSFKMAIDSVIIGNFEDFIERSAVEDNNKSQAFIPCGVDGMVENAFATWIGDQRYVLICPGFLITLSQQPNEELRFNAMLHAIAHELGHHIDSGALGPVGEAIYAPYLNCITRKYVGYFKLSNEDAKFCNKTKGNENVCNQKVTSSHAKELIADQWGIKVSAIHARNQGYNIGQTDSMLINSWANLCGTDDEGIHPTGDFRINILLRVNPDISNYLSCNNSNLKKRACTFDGEVII